MIIFQKFRVFLCLMGLFASVILLSGNNCNGDGSTEYENDLAAVDWRWSSAYGKITFYPVFQNVGTKDFKPTQAGKFHLGVSIIPEVGEVHHPIEVGAFGTFGLTVGETKMLVPGYERELYTNGRYYVEWWFELPGDMNNSNNRFISETMLGSEIETKYVGKKAF